jgi:hypothetical protein
MHAVVNGGGTMNNNSGVSGIIGIIGAVAGYFVVKHFFPSLVRVYLIICAVIAVITILLVIGIIVEAFRQSGAAARDLQKKERDAVFNKCLANLMELRRLAMGIRHPRIRKQSEEICSGMDKMLCMLKDRPQEILQAEYFLEESLSVMGSILTTYRKEEAAGVPAEEHAKKAEVCLKKLQLVMEKQYASLFAHDEPDLTEELETLKAVCRREGCVPVKTGEEAEDMTL